MRLVKVLESPPFIRAFGLVLLFAPFFNVCLTILSNPTIQGAWTLSFFSKVLINEALPYQVLNVLSIFIGSIMLRNSTQAWRAVLFLLGGHIILQILNLGKNIRAHWANGIMFLVNVVVFLFIFDQLAWKVKKTKKQPIPQKEAMTSEYPLIEFEELGPWAKLIEINETQVHLELLSPLSFEIGDRELDLILNENLVLKVKLQSTDGNRLGFHILNTSSELVERLQQAQLHFALAV